MSWKFFTCSLLLLLIHLIYYIFLVFIFVNNSNYTLLSIKRSLRNFVNENSKTYTWESYNRDLLSQRNGWHCIHHTHTFTGFKSTAKINGQTLKLTLYPNRVAKESKIVYLKNKRSTDSQSTTPNYLNRISKFFYLIMLWYIIYDSDLKTQKCVWFKKYKWLSVIYIKIITN